MGCFHSTNTDNNRSLSSHSNSRPLQPRAPILLFYLPSNVREVLTRIIASSLTNSETTAQTGQLNIRFVDVPNQRSSRKYWPSKFSSKGEYAAALYVADIRDRGSLLLNARTLNWLLKFVHEKYNFIIIVISTNEVQLAEFKSIISRRDVELVVLDEKNPETVVNFVDVISLSVERYYDKRYTSDTTIRGK